ncbi:MAG TPA: hypothetical protein VGF86_12430 [Candidatus Tumulicola sp.]
MVNPRANARVVAAAAIALIAASGCGGRGDGLQPSSGAQVGMPQVSRGAGSDVSVLKQLTKQVVIGSLADPNNGASNPYGLAVAPVSAGKLTAGDLVVCNFNSKSNQQGSGKSIVAIHPKPGSKPIHLTASQTVLGCDALALSSDDTIWAAAMVANDNPVIGADGKLLVNIYGKPFSQPWGQIFAAPQSAPPAFYETNAATGTVVRINLGSSFTYDVIASNFPRNHGVAGTALAPSGLAYDASNDTLYFVDGKNDTLVAFSNVSNIPAGGIQAKKNGTEFEGPNASDARIVFSGKPLNGPISTALLPNGNLVVGNTLDPDGKNLMVEIATDGSLLDVLNVDKGPAGSIFGMVATGTSNSNTKVYFNDDNDTNLQVLEH